LRLALAPFQRAIGWRSLLQIVTAFGPFVAIWIAMYFSLQISYWLTLALALPAAGLVVRIFIIQHDCGHGSFFRSKRANDVVGWFASLITLTPYDNWRRQHAGHHANWNNLDRRESGADIYSTCLTTDEYRDKSRWQRFVYRACRHPAVAHVAIPPLVFLLLYRLPFDTPAAWRKERWSVHLTNLAILAVVMGLGFAVGFGAFAKVQLPITIAAAIVGIWLFSVQHKFERVLWYRKAEWNMTAVSLHGTSLLRLPKILQWFTGNIGFHHVHHLNPRIPNYRLEKCHDATPALQVTPVLTLRNALRASGYALWDEASGRMVRFKDC
jgi:omega-6 fatty acid desaturase (delta-12 desaturase)